MFYNSIGQWRPLLRRLGDSKPGLQRDLIFDDDVEEEDL